MSDGGGAPVAFAIGEGATPGVGDYDLIPAGPEPAHYQFVGVDSGGYSVRFARVGPGLGAYVDSAVVNGRTVYAFVGQGNGTYRVGRPLPLAVVGLPAFLALFYALATLIARLFWSDGVGRIAALALAFGLCEWLRSFLFTGFPWNAIGYAATPMPLMMQSASVVNLATINMLAVFVFAAPALIATGRGSRIGLAAALVLLTAHVGFGFYRLAQPAPPVGEPPLTVRLVQPVIDQAKKIDDRERAAIFEEHLALTIGAPENGSKRPDIVVWPETSIPFILTAIAIKLDSRGPVFFVHDRVGLHGRRLRLLKFRTMRPVGETNGDMVRECDRTFPHSVRNNSHAAPMSPSPDPQISASFSHSALPGCVAYPLP